MIQFLQYVLVIIGIITFLFSMILFGYQINLLLNLSKKKTISIPNLALYLGLGLSFYIIFEYAFITVWEINWLTGFWVFFIEDIFFIIKIRKKLKIYLIGLKIKMKEKITKKLNDFDLKKYIFPFIFVTVFTIYLFGSIIIPELKSGIPEWDVIDWMGGVYNLLRNGHLRYDTIKAYPAGFMFFYSGVMNVFLFLNQNITLLHILFKIWPLFNILIIFIFSIIYVLQTNTKFKIEIIVLGFFSLLFNFSFWTRALISIPSSLCDFLFILFLISYFNLELSRESQAVLIVGMILIHPFNGMIYLGIILLNRFLDLFVSKEKINGQLKSIQYFKDRVIYLLKVNIKPILISVSMLSIWFIHLTIKYSPLWIENYLYYFQSFNLSICENLVIFIRNLTNDWISIRHIENFFVGEGNINNNPSAYFFNVTLHDLLLIPLISLLIPGKRIYKNYKNERLIRFIKVFFLILTFLWFIQVFYHYDFIHNIIGSDYFDSFFNEGFYFVYKKRFLIIIALPCLILFIHFFYSLFIGFDKIIKKIGLLKEELHTNYENRILTSKKIFSLLILIILIIAQSDAIIKVYHFIPLSYTKTTYDFRDYIDESYDNYTILIDRDDYALYLTFKSFLQDDQTLEYEHLNINNTLFNNYITANLTRFDFLIISAENQNYNNFLINSSSLGIFIFKTTDLAILRINN